MSQREDLTSQKTFTRWMEVSPEVVMLQEHISDDPVVRRALRSLLVMAHSMGILDGEVTILEMTGVCPEALTAARVSRDKFLAVREGA